MRIIWLSPEPPVPPLTGGRERARRMLCYLVQQHQIHLVTFVEAVEEGSLAQLRIAGMTVSAVPYPPTLGKSSHDMVRAVRRVGDGVFHIQGLEMWRYRRRDKPTILDLHDVPSVLTERRAALAPIPGRLRAWRQRRQMRLLRGLEKRACEEAAAIVVPTSSDRQLLLERHPGLARAVVIPNGIRHDDWRFSDGEPDHPTILFPAALNWPVNVDATRLLVEQILPRVAAEVPDVRLIIAGRRPNRDLVRLAERKPAFTLVPDPVEMQPLFEQATVVAVPLQAATGSRLKILQALATGRPVVSTPLGAAGLGLTPGHHLVIAPLLAPFVHKLTQLLLDGKLRQRLRDAGREAVKGHDWHRFLPRLDTIYADEHHLSHTLSSLP